VILLLAFALAAPGPKDPPKPPAENPLLGEWVVESHVASGKPLPRFGKPERVTITKDRWKVTKELESESNLTLDPTKDPPHIDVWVPAQGDDDKDSRARGIYKLDGDTLVVCYTLSVDRPTKFESPPKSGMWMMTLKRVKSSK
jgi:uncharacterized protein (TIGR03067 family)